MAKKKTAKNKKQMRLFSNDYWYGIALAVFFAVSIFITNVAIPTSDSESTTYLWIGAILLYFGWAGYDSAKSRTYKAIVRVGATTAFISVFAAMLTFFIIDNLFLDVVSQQSDKIWGFSHSGYTTMIEYINYSLFKGLIFVLPVSVMLGALSAFIGGWIRKKIN